MGPIIEKVPALVSAGWLEGHMDSPNLMVIDATMPKVGVEGAGPENMQIRGAVFMDLKNKWSRKEATFPNTMLQPKDFEEAARVMGVNQDSVLVFYDDHGIYSSARAWWMFRSMGHEQVAVLDGGLPSWIAEGFEVEEKKTIRKDRGDFCASWSAEFFVDQGEVLGSLEDKSCRILDARAEDRFKGKVKEPRAGLRSGHIPGSESLPYTVLLENGKMKKTNALKQIFDLSTGDADRLIFSCGSGITACVLALGAANSGWDKMAVYDGSWTEWGSLKELPVERS